MHRKDVKIIHILSKPDTDREINSQKSLIKLGYRYIRLINPIYTDYPPTHNVIDNRVDFITGKTKPDPNKWGLTSGHYGCWQGHISSILSSFVDSDYTLICESDCLLTVDVDYFKDMVDESINTLDKFNYKIVRFESPNQQTNFGKKISNNLYECDKMMLGHCYMIHSKDRDFYINRIDNVGWHTFDLWINEAFMRANEKMLTFKDLNLTKQLEGFSLVDKVYRNEKTKGGE